MTEAVNEKPGGEPAGFRSEDERIIEIEIERLRDFKDHPFKIKADDQMQDLMESIERYGILTPLIVRPLPEGVYEIVSGHRRKHAAKQLGYRKVPVIIRVLSDEEAVISMVDSNLQRVVIRPSEKAFAIKMKYEVQKQSPGRKKGSREGQKRQGVRTVQILGKETGESPKQIQRYLRITNLVPELLEKLDDGELSFTPAVEVSSLKTNEQKNLLEAMQFVQSSPSLSQAMRIKELSHAGTLDLEKMKTILAEVKKGEINRVTFKNEQLHQFFPREYTAERMKTEILKILEQWKQGDFT